MARQKYLFWSMICILGVLLQGCASTHDVPLAKKDLQSVQNVKFCRYQFRGYVKETTGSKVASAAVAAPFMIFGALGGAIGGGLYGSVKSNMMLSAGKELQAK